MYRTIFFDLDGTLTNPGTGITNSVAYALEKIGIRTTDRKALYRFIGPPLNDAFETFYGFSPEECRRAIAYYREYFRDRGIFENTPYDGISELLQSLKNNGKQLVVATSKPELFAVRILEHFDLDRYFDFVAGATMDSSRSKKAEVLRYALDRCAGAELSTSVMVGDREHDIQGAKAVGMDAIGVLYGYGSERELRAAGAAHLARDAKEIAALIFQNV